MDSRSRLDRQRARLRERLQDLSARSAAVLPSGGVAGGVQEGLPRAPIYPGSLRDLMALPDLPQAFRPSSLPMYGTRAAASSGAPANAAVRALGAPDSGDIKGQAEYIQAVSDALDALPRTPYHDATRARFRELLEGGAGDEDDSALFPPRAYTPRPHVYPGGGLVFCPHRGGRIFIDCILGNDDHVEGKEGYPVGRYFSFWACEDDDGRVDWDVVGYLEENMPPRHGLLVGPSPLYWHPHIEIEGDKGRLLLRRFHDLFGSDCYFGAQNFLADDGRGGDSRGLCLDVIQRGCWASFARLGEFCARCRHGVAGRFVDLPHRGGGACRKCLAKHGYLVVPEEDQVKFNGASWNKQVKQAEKKFIRDAGCSLWRIVRSLSPIHPEADDYAHGGHQEIFYEGAVNAMFRKEAREFAPHSIPELDRDYPKIVVDLTRSASAFNTCEEMQLGEGIASFGRLRLGIIRPRLSKKLYMFSLRSGSLISWSGWA